MFPEIELDEIVFNPSILNEDITTLLRYPPATIKILIVADGSITFGASPIGFTLLKVLEILNNTQHQDFPSYARFNVTTAHRNSDLSADISGFNFSSGSLDEYDELWLFGINGGDYVAATDSYETYLTSSELNVIGDFMENGGGVMAMGDHEDLGLGLCSSVPRVRNMRKWWFRGTIPPNQSKAPDRVDLTRNDTVQLVAGADPGSGGQSDVVPQPITLKPYYKPRLALYQPFISPYRRLYSKYPHPVLCGPLGPIEVFPDHAHEGDCVMPQDETLNFPTSLGNKAEYPGGVRPEIIATGYNVVGRTKNGHTITENRPFGLLGVYDGHDVPEKNIGRVLVDATWHHWFDVNLQGIEAGAHEDDGSDDSDDWRQIQAFFRNCAIWLAPKTKQQAMRIAGQYIIYHVYPINKNYFTWKNELAINPSIDIYKEIGKYSLDVLERVTGKCGKLVWLWDFTRVIELEEIWRIDPAIMKRLRPDLIPEKELNLEIDNLEIQSDLIAAQIAEDTVIPVLYGACMMALWSEIESMESNPRLTKQSADKRLERLAKRAPKLMQKAAKKALPLAMESMQQEMEAIEQHCHKVLQAGEKLKKG